MFGAPVAAHQLSTDVFARENYGYRFGFKPNPVEILTTISGVNFDAAMVDPLTVDVDGRRVPVIGGIVALVAQERDPAPKFVRQNSSPEERAVVPSVSSAWRTSSCGWGPCSSSFGRRVGVSSRGAR